MRNKKYQLDDERILKAASSSLKENRKLKNSLVTIGAGLAGLMLFTGAPVFAEEVDTTAVTSTTQSEAVVMNVSDDEMDSAETNEASADLNETTDAVESTSTETENIVDNGTDNIGDDLNAENNSVVESEETVDATEDSSAETDSSSKENVIANAVITGAENGNILAAVTTDEVQKETGMTEEQIIAIYNKYFPGETWEDTWDDESESVLYDNFFNNVASDAYEEKTANGVTYETISSENGVFREEALRMINFIRELAGLNPVTLSDEYNTYCQAGVEYLAENNLNISHIAAAEINEYGIVTGAKAGYEDAHEGLMGSNLSQGTTGYITVNELILNFFSDDDISNRTNPGHRYWILDPTLTEIGIGYCCTSQKQYLAVYIEGDRDTSSLSDSYNNSWPASGAFPYELLEETANYDQTPWSIMLGEDYQNTSNYTIGEDFKITITDDEGHTYVIDDLYDFLSDSNKETSLTGDWYTYATLYGRPHALKITFNPGSMYADYLYQIGEDGEYIGYEALKGHKFTVTVNGLYIDGQEDVITYDVDFVSMFDMVEKANEQSEEPEQSEDFQDVYDLIDALPSTITLSNKTAVEEARRAYDALEDKTDFDSTKLNKLTSAETEIARLEKDAEDTSKANDVISAISALPEKSSVTLDNESAIIAARTAYNSLTDDQKAKVTNLTKLTDAEAAIVSLKDNAEKVNAVYDLIDALPSTITLSDKTSVENARKAYDALEDKSDFDSTKLYKLTSAETEIARLEKDAEDTSKANDVITLITALPEKTSVTLDNESAVIAARTAYDGLTDDQKAKVTNLTKLTDAETRIAEIKNENTTNQNAANNVITLINALPSELTLDDKAAVDNAYTYYNALTDAQKALVNTNTVNKLINAKNTVDNLYNEYIANYNAAQNVINAASNLPTELTLDDESSVVALRTAYDALNDTAKAMVDEGTVSKLINAENAISALKVQLKKQQDADAVEVLIDNIPEALALTDKTAVENARKAYDALEDKSLVDSSKLTKLTSAETEIARLEKDKADQDEADRVDLLISQISDTVTLADENNILAARTAYNSLTDDQKAKVAKLSKLTDAEATIISLKDKAEKINAVYDLIDALPSTITLSDKISVENARKAYDELEDKSAFDSTKLYKLTSAETEIARLEKDAEDTSKANDVISVIGALPEKASVTLDNESAVIAARTAYDGLTDDQKAKVTNLTKLTDAETRIAEIKNENTTNQNAANNVITLINALPSELTLDDKAAVDNAYTYYNALTDDQKNLIDSNTLNKLTTAKITVDSLYNEYIANYNAAQNVIDAASNLPTELTLDDEPSVVALRTAYDALNDTAKAMVDEGTVSKLINAENAISALKVQLKKQQDADAVEDLIDNIPETLTLDDKTAVENARNAYDALEDKSLVDSSKLTKLTSAETEIARLEKLAEEQREVDEVEKMIDDLSSVISLDDKTTIVSIRNAYEQLTNKTLFDSEKLQKLTDAENEIARLEKSVANKEAADNVARLIDELPDTITLLDKTSVENARKAYDELEDQSLLDALKLVKLTSAESEIARLEKDAADQIEANKVIDLISAIPNEDDITLSNELDVLNARNAYDSLTDEQKNKVTNINTLFNAESRITVLKAQNVNDQEAANNVIELIDALPEVPGLSDKTAVDNAYASYNVLSDTQKALVSSEKTLKLSAAKFIVDEAYNNYLIDYNAAQSVINTITSIPTSITLDDESDVVAARTEYDALNNNAKEMISKEILNRLETAENAIETLKADQNNKEAAEKVENEINQLPSEEEITLNDADKIKSAQTNYDNLTEAQKNLISESAKNTLVKANTKINALVKEQELNIEAAKAVETSIWDIPSELSYDDYEIVKLAKDSYSALSSEQKSLVSSSAIDYLKTSVDKMNVIVVNRNADVKAANEVAQKIDELDAEVSIENREKIESVKLAFDALTDEQKSYVDVIYIEKLNTQVEQLNQLLVLEDVKNVESLINNIPDVITIDDEETITKAVNAYGNLSEDAKKTVDSTLVEKMRAAQISLDNLKVNNSNQEKARNIINELIDLSKINNITTKIRNKIFDIHKQILSLIPEARLYITPEYENLEAALVNKAVTSEAQDFINEVNDKLPEYSSIVLKDKEIIESLYEKYESLHSETKDKLENDDDFVKLKEAKDKIETLEKEQIDNQNIQNLIDMVITIKDPSELTLDDQGEVSEAYAAYLELSEEAKEMVPEEVKEKLYSAVAAIDVLKKDEFKSGKTTVDPENLFETLDTFYDDNPSTGISRDNNSGALAASILSILGLSGVAFKRRKERK